MKQEIINFVEKESWFSWEEGNDMFATREFGDVGEEMYSETDLEEGNRIADLLMETFDYIEDVIVNVVDEWVTIEIELNDE